MEAVNYRSIKPSDGQIRAVGKALISWRTVYPEIKDLPDSNASLNKLAVMIACEMQNPDGPRKQILARLHMRINAMRQRMESKNILVTAKR